MNEYDSQQKRMNDGAMFYQQMIRHLIKNNFILPSPPDFTNKSYQNINISIIYNNGTKTGSKNKHHKEKPIKEK